MMKKVLLGTTAIIGASAVMAGAALASDPPQLTLNGYTTFEAWFIDQDDNKAVNTTTGVNGQNRGVAFDLNDAEVHFEAKAKADNGLEYGAHMEVSVSGQSGVGGIISDEASVWFQGGWGWLEVGNNDGAEDIVKIHGASILGGDGGWDGDAPYNVPSQWTTSSQRGVNPVGDTSDANKVTYFTPTFSGFKAGVSYTPDSGDNFDIAGGNGTGVRDTTSTTNYDNSVDFGVSYAGTFNDVAVAVSGRYMTGDWELNDFGGATTEKKNISSWAIGGKVTYQGFTLASGYGDNGDSGVTKSAKAAGADAGIWYDVALAYATGPYKVTGGYFHAETGISTALGDDEVDWYTVTGNYNVAPGLDTFVEYDNISWSAATTATTGDVDTNIFMVGTKVSF